ncbi:MAG: hypothetical protein WBA93_30965 [Microcoleaceae cyanobacterium]
MLKLQDFIVLSAVLGGIMWCMFTLGFNSVEKEPTNDYFWIDNNRFNRESTITVQENMSNDEVFYCVVIQSEFDRQFIEFYEEEYATAKELRDSFLIAFKKGVFDVQ